MLFDIQQDKWWFTWKNEVHHIQCCQLLQYFWAKLENFEKKIHFHKNWAIFYLANRTFEKNITNFQSYP